MRPPSLPLRYEQPWLQPFQRNVEIRLAPMMTVLDIGGGRHPAVASDRRPPRVTYIGLDPDAQELGAAAPGSYDDLIVARAEERIPELADAVDLIVSWQVFEHVRSLEAVLCNSRDYLKPGGALVSFFSGRWSVFAMVNRVLPHFLGAPIVDRIASRSARNKPVFPAFYDCCSASAIRRLTADWSTVELVPFYRGAVYFAFARPIQRAYVAYENFVRRAGWLDTATHYLLIANP
jgi:2-polyprenyl-6-hydroxyphenyl methylase/3-demethylubiquinone-9 3-methyltransferase